MRLIDEVVGYANANAAAARDANDQQTWAAHHRNCVRIRDEHAAEIERLRGMHQDMCRVAGNLGDENERLRAERDTFAARLGAERLGTPPLAQENERLRALLKENGIEDMPQMQSEQTSRSIRER